MRNAVAFIVLCAILLGAAAGARADDRIVLKNGSVVSGHVVRVTEEVVIIEVGDLGRVRIPREQVLRIMTGDAPPIRTGGTDEPVTPEPPVYDPLETPFRDLEEGQTVLVTYKSEDTGAYRYSGRRLVAKVEVAGFKRIKVLVDPSAGVLGYVWVPREEVERAVALDDHPDRRILLIEGMETASWVRGALLDGSTFAGRLDRLAQGNVLKLTSVAEGMDGEVVPTDVPLDEVREIESYSRGEALIRALATLETGEPVKFTLVDRPDPVEGRWLGQEGHFLRIETLDGPEATPRVVGIFRGAPVSEIATLPDRLRGAFTGVSLGDALTVTTVTVGKESVVRRTVTGTLAAASIRSLALATPDGPEEFEVDAIRDLERPREDRVKPLMARKDASEARTVLSVMPGMKKDEAEEILGGEQPGIKVLYADGLVDKVYLRPPMQGPFFGIELGGSFRTCTRDTDLVFGIVEEPVQESEHRVLTMYSHTLKGLVVKLFVADTDRILAMEVARR